MVKKTKSSKKINIAIKCQCEDRAVPRPESLLKRVTCRECGKTYKTNSNTKVCFNCQKVLSRSN